MQSGSSPPPRLVLEEAPTILVDGKSVQELIEGVRVLMASDTSTLLLLDRSGTVLEPAASAGLGRRWRGATHVPVGSGFAGRVAATVEPILIEDVNEQTVLNPVLRDFGLRQLLGVPVLGSRGLLGVLHAGWRTPRPLTLEDTERLKAAAHDLGQRLSARTRDDAHLAALALQRSLLPGAPPSIDGLDVAVRYLPADGDLGGDWYDVFKLPGGKVGIVMGDVEGHGLASAVAMGRLRSALRAYALDYDDPAEVLQRLDRKLTHFEPGITATVVYAVTQPPFDSVTIASAGHPAPLVARPGERCAIAADVPAGVLLGVDPERPRDQAAVSLPPGAALAFYTDGLVERRRDHYRRTDPYLERLRLVRRAFLAEDNAETACTRMISEGLGDDSVEDDVALAVVRRPLAPQT
ncbi:PP2C family protein-serine/threonine phosphatase [Nocardioides deserti]|uniref:SpoIIE family protein phosphatase n=1 Tax=Nocardioides deserti TaxID=1588644 RepID=A0ABR6U6N0_9ACTN|nr:GAF domain-containing SpoIIE family protein phosphatase [Nocardioides deserti]MBC2960090.1 SpoIIE family protein phosphatase [Nocardioides deserti]GGO74960.1 cyclic diguanylate phosphodiesterase [Nocardioides deserti]